MKSQCLKLRSVKLLDVELRTCAAAKSSLLFLASFARWVCAFLSMCLFTEVDEFTHRELLGY